VTLFGRTFDGTEIVSLVSMLLLLALWVGVWLGDRRDTKWFKAWNAERKARRDAEIAAEREKTRAPSENKEPRGPWS
jgi:uncharacterized iron-regulated membrane protein